MRWDIRFASVGTPPFSQTIRLPTTNSTDLKTQNKVEVNKEKVDAQQTEKERYSGKLPVEGMSVRCLKYDGSVFLSRGFDCKNFDKLELGQKYFNVYWYDENGDYRRRYVCSVEKRQRIYAGSPSHSITPDRKVRHRLPIQEILPIPVPAVVPVCVEDYDDPEDLYEDGDYARPRRGLGRMGGRVVNTLPPAYYYFICL